MNNSINPSVAIIIPVYNAESFLQECLDSLVNQSYKNFTVFCLDDCSTDNSYSILQEYASKHSFIKVFKNKQNLRIGKTLNALLDKVEGRYDYICRMDADDIAKSNRIYEQVLFMESNPNVDISSADAIMFGAIKQQVLSHPSTHDEIVRAMVVKCPLVHPNVIFRGSFVKKHNVRYNPNYYAEDYDLWVRCVVDYNATLANLNKTLLEYRVAEHQLTNYALKNNLFEDKEISYKLIKYIANKILEQGATKPFKASNNIPIIFGIDKSYASILPVVIQSIIDSSSASNNYDIIVLHNDLSKKDTEIIEQQAQNRENFCVRFLDITKHINNFPKTFFYNSGHISTASYYRLFIPLLFKNYKKCIYIDADVIVLDDIAKLFNSALQDNQLIASTVNYILVKTKKHTEENIQYYKEKLNIDKKDYKTCFYAGLLILNIEEIIKQNYHLELFYTTRRVNKPSTHDLDIFNSVFCGKCQILGHEWNFITNFIQDQYQENIDLRELEDIVNKKSYKIIHYASDEKPWNTKKVLLSKYFWKFAKKSSLYKKIKLNYYKKIIIKIINKILTIDLSFTSHTKPQIIILEVKLFKFSFIIKL